MSDTSITLDLRASLDGREVDLTVAEIGVLSLPLNRTLNKLSVPEEKITRSEVALAYEPQHQEPAFIELRLHSAKRGSLVLEVVAQALDAIGLDPVSAKAVLLSVLANALWDPTRTKTVISDLARGARRVANSAKGKVIMVSVAIRNKIRRFKITVNLDESVRVEDAGSEERDLDNQIGEGEE